MSDEPRDFTMIPNWVIRDSVLSGNELLVLIALWSRVNQQRVSWPSKRQLAADSHLSEATVKRALPMLESRGLITMQVRPRGDGTNASNLYHLPLLPWQRPKQGEAYSHLVRTVNKQGEGVTVNPPGGQGEPVEGVSVTREEDPGEEDTREENIRPELPFEREQDLYSLNAPEAKATVKQVSYIRDLYIHHYNRVPNSDDVNRIRALTSERAAETIKAYLRVVGRNGMYEGPEDGTDEYEALSDTGQLWADNGMVPDVWDTTPAEPSTHTSASAGVFAGMFSSKHFEW